MYYNFELVMAGAILLTAMLIGGIFLKIKRRRDERSEALAKENEPDAASDEA